MQPDSHLFEVRPARLADEPDVLEICHLTGDPRVDRYLFGLRWCLDYLWHETENCFVGVDRRNGRVVGYILGALDSAAQAKRQNRVMLPQAKQYWKQLDKKTASDRRFIVFMRWFDWQVFRSLFQNYPAHLHINLAPEYQRRGVGERLLAAYEENLRQKRIPGYHLGVGADNQVGLNFYYKMGLEQLSVFPKVGKPLVVAFGRRLG
jgi:ribosomal protein S18 acetylase RimI-like enzyme